MVPFKKIAIEIMDEVTAKKRHISGEPYVALIGSTSTPLCFIEVIPNKGMIGVGFLDQQQREYLTYQFQKKDRQSNILKYGHT